ncbi:proline-rich receptor-like protein kinase PERK1 [Cinnamomum micranthum f. kanehirae]|uniref:non-specific serine/threonine protein kinase n=1 Tax=Cinnamomum micranthum f. kanehirae TaxID=337451 RepID=A0A3S3NEX3_9MAGN|nr:proline-rich receptor-like protein kinase PERK1 [Cinnamomum micranthum f. kanehirae]
MHHRHLVTLVGCCAQLRVLIYEYIPNNTLEFHLHGEGRPTMEWSMRMKIALGPAYGIAYPHEDYYPKIIHRDVKASNILLDNDYEAKACLITALWDFFGFNVSGVTAEQSRGALSILCVAAKIVSRDHWFSLAGCY